LKGRGQTLGRVTAGPLVRKPGKEMPGEYTKGEECRKGEGEKGQVKREFGIRWGENCKVHTLEVILEGKLRKTEKNFGKITALKVAP